MIFLPHRFRFLFVLALSGVNHVGGDLPPETQCSDSCAETNNWVDFDASDEGQGKIYCCSVDVRSTT